MNLETGKLYRVCLDTATNTIEVSCFGMDALDSELEGTYSSTEELPDWVQRRLAVLMISTAKPPTVEVSDVGRRINNNTFWIFPE